MPRVLLLHTNEEYARTLAEAVDEYLPAYHTDVVSRVPLRERLQAVTRPKYDVVQADELIVNGVIGAAASLVRDVELVTSVRGWADYTNAHGQYGRLRRASIGARTRFTLARSRATIFISEITRSRFTDRYQVAESSVVPRPIDVDCYGTGTDADRDTFDLLTVTNLRYAEKYRGVRTILDGLKPLFADKPELRFRIAGGGQYLDNLERELQGYPYADRVELLGYVDGIEDEFASADLFTYVSFLDSFGTVVLEAQAAGLPVIVGDASGISDVVEDERSLFEPTPDGVTDAVRAALTDGELRRALARRSCERMTTYNRRCVEGHAAVWQSVLNAR